MLLNGKLVIGEVGEFYVVNPATEQDISTPVPHASSAQVNSAVAGAKLAFVPWSNLSLEQRKVFLKSAKNVLAQHVEEIAQILSTEQGKPILQAESEVSSALSFFDDADKVCVPTEKISQTKTHSLEIHHRPIGVVAAIVPWNYPVHIAVMKLVSALVFGNTVVLKPSPNTPLSTLKIGELLRDVFPAGVLNILTGPDTRDGQSVGDFLSEHPNVALVSFTGSILTGKGIVEKSAKSLKRMILELGGNDPAIVLPDADIDSAAAGVLEGGLINCGQICCGIKRVFVHAKIYDEFVDKISKLATDKEAQVGPGTVPHVTIGPLNNRAQFDKICNLVADAAAHGCRISAGGKRCGTSGYFYAPTIVANIAEGVRLVDEEQFGPVLPILKYQTVEEAIVRANNTHYGLGASVWGTDPLAVNSVAHQLQAGIVWTNEHAGDIPGLPFGGMKESGIGREGPSFDLHTYTEAQSMKLMRELGPLHAPTRE